MRSVSTQGAWLRRQLVARLTLLLAVFCAFSQVSDALHWVLVEHERCAQHGEWVHDGDEHHADAAADSSPAADQVSIVAADGEQHGHDHCKFLHDARELTPPRSPQLAVLAPSPLESRGVVRASDGHAPIALHRLAPKTSPPARG